MAIGLGFMYLLLSLICTAVLEGLESWLKMRAVDLERGIRELLHDPDGTGLTQQLFDHPLINGLFRGEYNPKMLIGKGDDRRLELRSKMPSYIPAGNFALALLDVVARGPVISRLGPNATDEERTAAEAEINKNAGAAADVLKIDRVKIQLPTIRNPVVQRAILTAIDAAENDFAKTRANLEAWYTTGTDRVSGWYKRRTQWMLFALGLIIAVVANADSVTVAERLWRNAPLRQAVAGDAQVSIASVKPEASGPTHDQVRRLDSLGTLGLPIGWSNVDFWAPWQHRAGKDCPPGVHCSAAYPWVIYLVFPILGWLMTAIALSLGAPFWFDTLNRIMALRSTVKPAKSPKAPASNGRQPPPTTIVTTAIPEARALSTGARLE